MVKCTIISNAKMGLIGFEHPKSHLGCVMMTAYDLFLFCVDESVCCFKIHWWLISGPHKRHEDIFYTEIKQKILFELVSHSSINFKPFQLRHICVIQDILCLQSSFHITTPVLFFHISYVRPDDM